MSLTSHLRNAQSPINKFLVARFPNTGPVTREYSAALLNAETVRPIGDVPYSTLGIALDYRLRYYFRITPFASLVAWGGAKRASNQEIWEDIEGGSYAIQARPNDPSLPLETIEGFFRSLDDTLLEMQPPGRQLNRDQEKELARYCIVLALFEEIFRAGPRLTSPLFLSGIKPTVSDLLNIAAAHWVDDLCALSQMFFKVFKNDLDKEAFLNPTFDGSRDVGGADADFILNSCLIDVKSTINPSVTKTWLHQILGYVLLDYSDQYQLDRCGLYLARQGRFIDWPLDDLVERLTGQTSPPLKDMRQEFKEVATSARK